MVDHRRALADTSILVGLEANRISTAVLEGYSGVSL